MKQTPVTICPDVQPENLRRLAANVVLRAVQEAQERNPIKSLDACLWLTSKSAAIWLDAAGLPFGDALGLLTAGKLSGRVKTKGRTK